MRAEGTMLRGALSQFERAGQGTLTAAQESEKPRSLRSVPARGADETRRSGRMAADHIGHHTVQRRRDQFPELVQQSDWG
jgi:hypothetical protein